MDVFPELNPQQQLIDLQPAQEFFIGIDSDGCVFDTMEIKQKECFCPNFIEYFGLQSVSKYARETWEFVNLYSKTRGINRFLALIEAVKLLKERPEVEALGVDVSQLPSVAKWIKEETRLGNPVLKEFEKTANDPEITNLLDWSLKVNESIADIVHGIEPFPLVVDSLKKMQEKSDAIVVSQTPGEALEREWIENNLDQYVRVIAGQEYGTKTEQLNLAAVVKYPKDKILMIGDAPGDRISAEVNGVLFYPINPGHEKASWKKFQNEALDKFFDGGYEGDYQKTLIDEFEGCLRETPPWKN